MRELGLVPPKNLNIIPIHIHPHQPINPKAQKKDRPNNSYSFSVNFLGE